MSHKVLCAIKDLLFIVSCNYEGFKANSITLSIRFSHTFFTNSLIDSLFIQKIFPKYCGPGDVLVLGQQQGTHAAGVPAPVACVFWGEKTGQETGERFLTRVHALMEVREPCEDAWELVAWEGVWGGGISAAP